jgi:general stress protein 26
MSAPTTQLDERFSDAAAEPTTWPQTQQIIEQAELFWICTVRADGRPHVSPLVAVWLDDRLYFSTGPDEQKAHNLAANSAVTLITGENSWDHGMDVVIEGKAETVTEQELLSRLADAWATKWDGRWHYRADEGGFRREGGGLALVYAVSPSKVLAFGKGTFSHTRHRFQ